MMEIAVDNQYNTYSQNKAVPKRTKGRKHII